MLMFLPSTKPASFSPYDRLPSLAAELVGRNVAAIYATDVPSAFAVEAQQESGIDRIIPGKGTVRTVPVADVRSSFDRHYGSRGVGGKSADGNDRPSQGR